LYYFEVHLLYASLVGLAAWILTSLRLGSATAKYWIWVAASFNFLLPLGAILDKFGASHLLWATPFGVIGNLANNISRGLVATVLTVVWWLGAGLMFTRLCLRLQAERRDAQPTADQGDFRQPAGLLAHGVPIKFSQRRAKGILPIFGTSLWDSAWPGPSHELCKEFVLESHE